MLAWSEHLDFDAYTMEWAQCATTLASEAMVPVDEGSYFASVDSGGLQQGDARLVWHTRDTWAPLSQPVPTA